MEPMETQAKKTVVYRECGPDELENLTRQGWELDKDLSTPLKEQYLLFRTETMVPDKKAHQGYSERKTKAAPLAVGALGIDSLWTMPQGALLLTALHKNHPDGLVLGELAYLVTMSKGKALHELNGLERDGYVVNSDKLWYLAPGVNEVITSKKAQKAQKPKALSPEQQEVLNYMSRENSPTLKCAQYWCKLSKAVVAQRVKELIALGRLKKTGVGRGTRWFVVEVCG